MTDMLRDCLQRLPLIAILRGMKPEEAPWVLEALVGFSILEVPLNSPRPLESIAYLVAPCTIRCPDRRRHGPDRG